MSRPAAHPPAIPSAAFSPISAEHRAPLAAEEPPGEAREILCVQPDVTGIDRAFDYVDVEGSPDPSPTGEHAGGAPPTRPGTIVRVPLGPRHVRGWVLGAGSGERAEALRVIERVLSIGPAPDLVELARFGAWRYAGRLRPFLLAGSPPRQVSRPAARGAGTPQRSPAEVDGVRLATAAALERPCSVLRLPPGASRLSVVEETIARVGPGVLVLCPTHHDVALLRGRLGRAGHGVAVHPEDFAAASGGGRVVIGNRTAAFAPAPELAAVVVLDAHAETYREERTPTWDARVLVAERARRAGVPCLFVSPCPPLFLSPSAELVSIPASLERAGWPALEVLDRREDDPRSGLYAPELGTIIRAALRAEPDRPVLAVLNRTGRARLLSCASCGELARCEHCGAALVQLQRPEPGTAGVLSCPACASTRPLVCASCGGRRLRLLRVGTARAREELAALVGVEVAEVSGPKGRDRPLPTAPVLVGTEAVLHRARAAALVIFLDFDQELLAPRYLAGEQAMALLSRAGRLVGPRQGQGPFVRRVVVQTRLPRHEVLVAAALGDPGRFATDELARRALLRLPPYGALCLVSGEGAARVGTALRRAGLEVATRADASVLVRAPDETTLAETLSALVPPEPGLRVEVDPISV